MEKKKVTKKKTVKKDPIIDYVHKNYGRYIFKLPEKDEKYNSEDFIHSGSYFLNYIMTGDFLCGYAKRGRIVELFGKEGVAKTTLALSACNETLLFGKVLYGNAELGLNEFYAKNLIIKNHKNFYYFHAPYGEQFFEIAENLLKKFKFDLFVLDSIGGTKPKKWKEGKYEKSDMGRHSTLVGKATDRIITLLERKKTAGIFINQLAGVIGEWGSPTNTKGGKTLKFLEWVRLQLTAPRDDKVEEKIKSLDDVVEDQSEEEIEDEEETKKKKINKEEIGTVITVKAVKNKLFIPQKSCQIKLIYGKGFDKIYDLVGFLKYKNVIITNKKTMKTFDSEKDKVKYKDEKFSAVDFYNKFETDKKFREEIIKEVNKEENSIEIKGEK
jgi:recombination protein RecA